MSSCSERLVCPDPGVFDDFVNDEADVEPEQVSSRGRSGSKSSVSEHGVVEGHSSGSSWNLSTGLWVANDMRSEKSKQLPGYPACRLVVAKLRGIVDVDCMFVEWVSCEPAAVQE